MAYINNNIVNLGSQYNYADVIAELAGLLSVGTRDNGKFYQADICAAKRINMWAKYKPVRSSHLVNQSDTWKADDGMCGFDITNALVSTTSSLKDIASKFTEDQKNGWEYAQPRGYSNEKYRLRDFNGYDHKAQPFVSGFSVPAIWSKAKDNIDVWFMGLIENDAYISVKDLAISNYYLGVALQEKGTTNVKRQTSSSQLKDVGLQFAFPTKDLPIGEYIAYPFISSRELTLATAENLVATIYTIPNCAAVELKVVTSDLKIILSGMYSPNANGTHKLDYYVQISTLTGGTKTLTNNILRLRYAGNSFDEALLLGEIEIALNSGNPITVSPTASTYEGTIDNVSSALQANSRLWISLNGGQYIEDTMPMASAGPKNA